MKETGFVERKGNINMFMYLNKSLECDLKSFLCECDCILFIEVSCVLLSSCGNINFSWRDKCNKCGKSKF